MPYCRGYSGGGQPGYPSPYPQQIPGPTQQSPYPQQPSAGGMYPQVPQQQSFTSQQPPIRTQSRLQSVTNAGQPLPSPRTQSVSTPTPQRALGSEGPRAGGEPAKAEADEEPGFFGRLFGGKKKTEEPLPVAAAAGGEAGADPNQPSVPVANSASWCASKPLDPESAEMLKSSTVSPSRSVITVQCSISPMHKYCMQH